MARLSDSVAPRGEDDLLLGRADQLGHLLARLLDRRLGLPAEGVVARRGVAEVLPQVGQHRLQHARVERRGGVVVHVDGQLQRHRSSGCEAALLYHVRQRMWTKQVHYKSRPPLFNASAQSGVQPRYCKLVGQPAPRPAGCRPRRPMMGPPITGSPPMTSVVGATTLSMTSVVGATKAHDIQAWCHPFQGPRLGHPMMGRPITGSPPGATNDAGHQSLGAVAAGVPGAGWSILEQAICAGLDLAAPKWSRKRPQWPGADAALTPPRR